MKKSSFRNNTKCFFNDTGFCKYGDHCRKMHYKSICAIDGCDKECQSRHPKPCKHGGKCKFHANNICAYKHDTLENNDVTFQTLVKSHELLVSENKKNLSKIKDLEVGLKSLTIKKDAEIESLKTKVKTLEQNIESKRVMLKVQDNALRKNLDTKTKDGILIMNLETKLKEFETDNSIIANEELKSIKKMS